MTPLFKVWLRHCSPHRLSEQRYIVYTFGDLHGDLAKARGALELAGVLSSDGSDVWTGQETVLVQLGDILDRGEDEIAILSLLRSLQIQAKEHGGAVFQVCLQKKKKKKKKKKLYVGLQTN
ncbi:putative metallo-dependent phosphatase [Helianthus annuus]|nr:putative metallo-dependent phosphatase [Helianthus annuus]